MLSVLKQEFKIHKKNIFITAIIFAAIYLCTIFSMHLSGLFESEKIQDISALWFGLSVGLGYIGAFFIALFKGSGSMNDILFKDTGYLIKTIPVSSWKLILGKMIIGLFEFIVYFALYLLFMTFIFHCGEEIALALSMDIKFNDFSREIVVLCVGIIVLFILIQSILNFSFTVYTSFTKKVKYSKIILAIIIYFLFSFVVELTGAFLNIIDFNLIDDILSVWILMGIFIVISVILYVGTCLLYDKKVNL